MSTAGTSIVACPAIQRPLIEFFNTCPRTRRTDTPTLIYTASAENRSGISSVINPISGKKMNVQLTYTQPRSTADVETVASCDAVCDATDEVGDLSATYTIDCTDGLRISEKINLRDWNESCKGNNTMIMEKIANMLDGLIPAVAAKQAAEMNPLIGNWSADVNPAYLTADEFLKFPTQTAAGAFDPTSYARLDLAKMQTGFCGRTLLTGGADIYAYQKLMNVGCCASSGLNVLDLMNAYGTATVYDRWIAAEFGNNVSILLQDQSVQLLTATWNAPMLDLGGMVDLDMTYRNGFSTVIEDPITGIPVDLKIKEDCEVVHIVMTATTKTVGLPNDLYPSGHPNEFVNFVAGVQVVNP